jgi:hypothetical protein
VAEAGVPAIVVTFADPPLLAAFERDLDRPGAPLLGDPDRLLYAAFGFGRASLARVWLDPRSVTHHLRLLARGRRPAPLPRQDTLQLGGDVVVDPGGRVGWVYASRGPEDRPAVAAIIEAMLRSASRAQPSGGSRRINRE